MNLAPTHDPCLEKRFEGHRHAVNCVDFDYSTKLLASGGDDKNVMVWHLKRNMRPYKFEGHTASVLSVNFSPSGNVLASGSRDKTVRLWTPSIQGRCVNFTAHAGAVRSVHFSSDGQYLATSSDDKSVKIWNTETRKFLMSLTQHSNWVRSAKFSYDGQLLVSGGDDRTVKVWDTNTKECVFSVPDQAGTVNAVAFHPRGTCIAAGESCKAVKMWDIRTKKLLQFYEVSSGDITSIDFHPDGNYILAGSQDKKMKIIDLLGGRLLYTINGHLDAVNGVCFSRSGDYFASASTDSDVLMWKTNFVESKVFSDGENSSCSQTSIPKSKIRPLSAPSYATYTNTVPSRKGISHEDRHERHVHNNVEWKRDSNSCNDLCDDNAFMADTRKAYIERLKEFAATSRGESTSTSRVRLHSEAHCECNKCGLHALNSSRHPRSSPVSAATNYSRAHGIFNGSVRNTASESSTCLPAGEESQQDFGCDIDVVHNILDDTVTLPKHKYESICHQITFLKKKLSRTEKCMFEFSDLVTLLEENLAVLEREYCG